MLKSSQHSGFNNLAEDVCILDAYVWFATNILYVPYGNLIYIATV